MLPHSFVHQTNKVWSSVFVVGGFLRERWFGRLSADLDLVVPCDAIKGAEILAKKFNKPWFILDADRDIARLTFSPSVTVDIAKMSPEGLAADLAARDLSINAIACPFVAELFDLEIPFHHLPFIDPCGGIQDLENKCIRGLDRLNFVSDPLRLLRVFRFCAAYGFEIEKTTLEWVKSLNASIQSVATERQLCELDKILLGPNLLRAFELMIATNLTKYIFVEADKCGYDEWMSSLCVWSRLNRFFQEPIYLGFAAQHIQSLTHYCSHPLTGLRRRQDLLYLVSLFYPLRDENWNSFAKRICLGVKDTHFGLKILQYSTELKKIKNSYLDKLTRFHFYRKCRELVPALIVIAVIFQELDLSQPCDFEFVSLILYECFDNHRPYLDPPILIDGNDVITHLKIKPGPLVGKFLLAVQEAQVMGSIEKKSDALKYLSQLFSDNS